MKRLLFFVLLLFATHINSDENFRTHLIEHLNEILELEELAIEDFVEQLKGAKKLEHSSKSRFSLLQIVVQQDANLEKRMVNAALK